MAKRDKSGKEQRKVAKKYHEDILLMRKETSTKPCKQEPQDAGKLLGLRDGEINTPVSSIPCFCFHVSVKCGFLFVCFCFCGVCVCICLYFCI